MPGDEATGDEGARELRRGYHDRIADLRASTFAILAGAVGGAEAATGILAGTGPVDPDAARAAATQHHRMAAAVDAEVVSLLALESPMARDLRVILASRDVSQLGLLCVGLAVALGGRTGCLDAIRAARLGGPLSGVGEATVGLLRRAEAAWIGLDVEMADQVIASVPGVRDQQVGFFTSLLRLDGLPIEAALDLGLAVRAYERLADHAVEIAERVLFAVQGTPSPLDQP